LQGKQNPSVATLTAGVSHFQKVEGQNIVSKGVFSAAINAKNPPRGRVLIHIELRLFPPERRANLDSSYVSSCWAFLAIFDSERYFLTFFQRLEAAVLDCREVYEYIFAAVSWGNEAETFLSVKPFY
jgi:hypothetical protein